MYTYIGTAARAPQDWVSVDQYQFPAVAVSCSLMERVAASCSHL